MTPRALALCAALALGAPWAARAAPACVEHGALGGTGAPAADGGVGGTGAPARNGGIGGTGAPQARQPGGMGGTGRPAEGGVGGTGAPIAEDGTGIVGTITGFASICVNGVEVHYEPDVPVTENGAGAGAARLAVGQVVAVEARSSARGLEARRIAILHAYEGPLSALAQSDIPMRVMGQPVRLAPDARVAADLQPGEPVRVSGLRNADGEVVATRIDRAPGLAEASAIGAVTPAGDLQGLALRGAALGPGKEVLVRGRWSGDALQVERIETDPTVPFAGRVRRAVVEGLVHAREAGRITLGGFTVTLESGTRFDGGGSDTLGTGRRVRVSGEFTGAREVRADRVELVRIDADARPDRERGQGGGRSEGERALSAETGADDRSGRRDGHGERRGPDDRLEREERVERAERPQRPDRVDKVERLDKVERPEKVERVERVERIERLEKD